MTCLDCKFYVREFKEKGYRTTSNCSGIVCSKFGMLTREIAGQKTTDYVCAYFSRKQGSSSTR